LAFALESAARAASWAFRVSTANVALSASCWAASAAAAAWGRGARAGGRVGGGSFLGDGGRRGVEGGEEGGARWSGGTRGCVCLRVRGGRACGRTARAGDGGPHLLRRGRLRHLLSHGLRHCSNRWHSRRAHCAEKARGLVAREAGRRRVWAAGCSVGGLVRSGDYWRPAGRVSAGCKCSKQLKEAIRCERSQQMLLQRAHAAGRRGGPRISPSPWLEALQSAHRLGAQPPLCDQCGERMTSSLAFASQWHAFGATSKPVPTGLDSASDTGVCKIERAVNWPQQK
jgi:hypothetical protein